MVVEAELMRICAPLYGSFALESLWTLILAAFFAYLSVLISSKQQLKKPGMAVVKFCRHNLTDWLSDTYRILRRWDTMDRCDLGQRFRFCRRLNATICRLQVAFALFSLTRWLHVNNVNGFRYLGYSFTCPLMQAEMILLIAPAVPCYKLQTVVTMLITNWCMLTGWYASSLAGDLWITDWQDVFVQQNVQNLTLKGRVVGISAVLCVILCCVQMPYLALLFNFSRRDDMPDGFNKMLLLTAVSWLGFPIWWFLSFEGASIISDTKLNGLAFTLLNIVAKGGFTLMMISMVKTFKRKQACTQPRERSGSTASCASLPPLPGEEPEVIVRPSRQLPTNQSLAWMIKAMKPFDEDDNLDDLPQSSPADKGPTGRADHLTNEELVKEFLRRMGMSPEECSKLGPKEGLNCYLATEDTADTAQQFELMINDHEIQKMAL